MCGHERRYIVFTSGAQSPLLVPLSLCALLSTAASRPSSWSKIPAVLAHLSKHDWVMWVDADTVVTNHDFRVETLVPPPKQGGPDLILVHEPGGHGEQMCVQTVF